MGWELQVLHGCKYRRVIVIVIVIGGNCDDVASHVFLYVYMICLYIRAFAAYYY